MDKKITINIPKEPYIKKLTNDKIINLTGQSGSGKSYYAQQNFNTSDYLIVDTDDIFNEIRFNKSSGINKELGTLFRNKYKELPSLEENFDLIYKEILDYCKNKKETIVIDSAQFHCIKNIDLLKGTIIIIRTDIDTCYKRAIDRWINTHNINNIPYTQEELEHYKGRKKKIYTWYKYTNEFIEKIDEL